MQHRHLWAAAIALVASISPAAAHTGAGTAAGFVAGFGHPIGGLDHVLAMVAVGILAAQMGGRALWLVPSAFVGMMVVGGILGVTGVAVPFVEIGIVGSIVVLGFVIALGRRLPVAAAMVLVGALAIFHGHAHGTEMPASVDGLQYGAGFVLATIVLHAAGIALGIGAQRIGEKVAPIAVRMGGAIIALTGVALAAS